MIIPFLTKFFKKVYKIITMTIVIIYENDLEIDIIPRRNLSFVYPDTIIHDLSRKPENI